MENLDIEKDNLRYTLDKLYKCRDLEISNLWQRSVFLSVFLILCFTAYGYISLEVFKIDYKKDILKFSLFNLVAVFILSIGIIFSIIWIMMAKGSKAWYEVYESAIHEFENENFDKLGLPIDNIMGNMGFPTENKNNNIFSTKGGAYSPSRINILIGQVSLILLIIFSIIHLFLNQLITNNIWLGLFTILIPMITYFISYFIINNKNIARSGFL